MKGCTFTTWVKKKKTENLQAIRVKDSTEDDLEYDFTDPNSAQYILDSLGIKFQELSFDFLQHLGNKVDLYSLERN